MGSGKLNMVVFITIMVMATMQMQSGVDAQTTHVVGGPVGWIIPSNPNVYTNWAASQSFAVGDVLVFNFTTGHTVAEVTRAAYNACTIANPISLFTTGPVNVTLNSSGTHYYICTITGHCTSGQKVALTVAGATPTPAPAAPTPTPTAAPTPTPTASPTPTPTASPTPTPTASPTPTPTPSPAGTPPSQSPAPTGPPASSPTGGSTPPAPGSASTPSAPGPESTTPETPNSANFLAAASPLTFLCIAMAAVYYY